MAGRKDPGSIRPVQYCPKFHVLSFGDKQRAEFDASQGDGLFHLAGHSRGRSTYQPDHRRQCDQRRAREGNIRKFVGNSGKSSADHPGQVPAALSPWPFILAISTVYIALLAPTAQTFWLALLLVSILGSVLMVIFAGFGLLVSIYSNSNRTSLSVSLVVLLLTLVETQLPSGGQTGNVGYLFKRINPIEATLQVTEKVLVNNRTITEMNNPLGSQGFWLLSPLLVALLVLVLLFVFGHAHLGLHARLGLEDKLKRLRSLRRGRSSALMIVFVLAGTFMFILASSSLAARALAFDSATKQSNQAGSLQISLDRRYEVTKTGDEFDFKTKVKNVDRHKQSGPLVVAMNIINLGSGQPVDPEDWSPERTQAIGSLKSGQASELTWTIESILKGDYLIYMVVTPKPVGSTSTSQPVASSAIHLTVKPHTRLNPGGILPLAFAVGNRHADCLDRGVVGFERD